MSNMQSKNNLTFYCFLSLAQVVLIQLTWIGHLVDNIVLSMVFWYEKYIYKSLHVYITPKLVYLPQTIQIGDRTVVFFTATNLIYFRTLLVAPVALLLKYEYPIMACFLVLLIGILDQIDLLIVRAQKIDSDDKSTDPLFEGFLDGFCNKFINILCLWTILQEFHLNETSTFISLAFVLLCYTTMVVEIGLGIILVQEYFYAVMNKNKKYSTSTSDSMEEKVKETIESIGMACLCLSTGYIEPFHHWSGVIGILSLFLTVRFAYGSWKKTIEIRKQIKISKKRVTINAPPKIQKTIAVFNALTPRDSNRRRQRAMTVDSTVSKVENNIDSKSISSLVSTPNDSVSSIPPTEETPKLLENSINPLLNVRQDVEDDCGSSTGSCETGEQTNHIMQRSVSLPEIWVDCRADKVFTIGCFDLFHEGHRILLQRMRQYGREVIVGVHDSRSIYKLKSRVPVDGTETRMLNVKRYADQVYCVSGTDPSNFITCIVHLKENETAVYIRGDDMADFPSRKVVEELMPVKFLPYTNGVSSTQLRKELFSHIGANDLEHLENVN